VCGDTMDLIDGKPTGSVRISFGFSSTLDDARQFLRFVHECFLDVADNTESSVADGLSANVADSISSAVCENVAVGDSQVIAHKVESAATAEEDDDDDDGGYDKEACRDTASRPLHIPADALQLVRMFTYPVKSCAAVQVNKSHVFLSSLVTDKQALIDVGQFLYCVAGPARCK